MARKTRPTWVPVVTGLIKKNGKVLVGLRPEDGNLPGLWEFPGGKIELGEDPEQALRRELKEELNIDANIGELVSVGTHAYDDVGILIFFYEVIYWKGEPSAKHHSDLQWVTLDELNSLEIPEANRKLMPKIESVFEQI